MIEHLLNGMTQAALRRWVLFFALLVGAGSFAAQNGRAMLLGGQTPNAFAAVAQTPNSIAGLNTPPQPNAAPPRGRRGPADVVTQPDGPRPASFGVAPNEPLVVNGREPQYRPERLTGLPVGPQQALNFTPPDDVLPAGGGGIGNAAVAPTPPVPEPSSILLTAFGMAMLGGLAWRRGRRIAA